MMKKILRFLACVFGTAAVVAIGTTIIAFPQLPPPPVVENTGAYVTGEALGMFGIALAAFSVTSAVLLGITLLIRRTRLPLAAAFVIAWIIVALGQGVTLFTKFPIPLNALIVGVQTVAMAALYHWLPGRKPKAAPEAVF
jgi:hypothetical protein